MPSMSLEQQMALASTLAIDLDAATEEIVMTMTEITTIVKAKCSNARVGMLVLASALATLSLDQHDPKSPLDPIDAAAGLVKMMPTLLLMLTERVLRNNGIDPEKGRRPDAQ